MNSPIPKNIFKKNLHFLLLILLISDVIFSFTQHFHVHLDGDVAINVMTSAKDPFGLAALLRHETSNSPNRFFAHWTFSNYFKTVPLLLQKLVSPIDSIYAACAIAKTIIQVFIIWLLSIYITGKSKILNKDFLIAAILITPLFQTSGYEGQMGIILRSITYTFAYALPLCLLLLFFLPFYKYIYHQRSKFNLLIKAGLFLLIPFLSLNGPVIPGVVLIVCPMILLHIAWNHFKKSSQLHFYRRLIHSINEIPKTFLFFFSLFIVFSLYSLYIGLYNSENVNPIPMAERYMRIPEGLFIELTMKLGPSLVIFIIILNTWIIYKKHKTPEGRKILTMLKWILLFSAIYILLLPFGGYRVYRPNIIRVDAMMPVVLCLIFIYGISSYFLSAHIAPRYKNWYVSLIIFFSLIFTYADEPITNENTCERQSMEEIANSKDKIVKLKNDCTVMSWYKITDYKESEVNAEMLKYWHVTSEKKYYYQE